MLCLSRKVGESVVIDDKTMVTVVEVRSGKVRLGFTAPREVPIDRLEIHKDKGRLVPTEDVR